jgi:ATP-binding cassette subfamily C (CFTR/MRP) protein 1
MDNVGNSNITVNGTIAYASQVPWIMNDTIKNNILFGKPYDEKKYK